MACRESVIPAKAGIHNRKIPDQAFGSEAQARRVGDDKITVRNDQNSGVHCTPKYDGFRVQLHKNGDKVTMFSRNLENMSHMFPELIEGTLKQIKAKTAILDTEALAYNTESEEFYPFQETTKRRRRRALTHL